MEIDKRSSRRWFLRRAVLAASLATLPGMSFGECKAEEDSTKAPANAVKYQNAPRNGQQCSECMYYIPDTQQCAGGRCQIVQGEIAADAWCMLYVDR